METLLRRDKNTFRLSASTCARNGLHIPLSLWPFFLSFSFYFFQLASVSVHFWCFTLATVPAGILSSLLTLSFYLSASIFFLIDFYCCRLDERTQTINFWRGEDLRSRDTCLPHTSPLSPTDRNRIIHHQIRDQILEVFLPEHTSTWLRPISRKRRTGEQKPITLFQRCRPFRGRPIAVRPSPLHNRSFGRASNKYWRGFFCRA